MKKFDNYINGAWAPPQTGQYTPNVNPGNTDETLGLFASSGAEDVQAAIGAADRAAQDWGAMPGPKRGAILYAFADLLRSLG